MKGTYEHSEFRKNPKTDLTHPRGQKSTGHPLWGGGKKYETIRGHLA